MENKRRYFVSFSCTDKFGGNRFGNIHISNVDNFKTDEVAEVIGNKNGYRNVIIISFQELKEHETY